MIYAKTGLKRIPDTCLKCKFRSYTRDTLYTITGQSNWKCSITNTQVPYTFVKEKRNWVYGKCKNCPLVEKE